MTYPLSLWIIAAIAEKKILNFDLQEKNVIEIFCFDFKFDRNEDWIYKFDLNENGIDSELCERITV